MTGVGFILGLFFTMMFGFLCGWVFSYRTASDEQLVRPFDIDSHEPEKEQTS